MLSFYQKYWRTAFDIALIVLTVYLIMFAFSHLYRIATPIFLSFLIFIFIEPPARWLTRLGIKKSIAAALSILIFTLVIVGAFVGAGIIVAKQVTGLAERLPVYQEILTDKFSLLMSKYNAMSPDVREKTEDVLSTITQWGQKAATSFLKTLGGYLTSFSTFIFNFAVGVILAYFLSLEIKDWKKLAADKTPKTFKTAFFFLKDNVFSGIAVYIKSQAKLISITFIIIFVALLILRVDNALTISILSAIFDVLPLLGVSTVFIPWIIYLFIVGQTTLALWLTLLLGVVVLMRQILEPKITGDTLGVSAFTMLAFMIVSLSLFGVAGVILSPLLLILVKALYDQGYFHQWIRPPMGEFDTPVQPPASKSHSSD